MNNIKDIEKAFNVVKDAEKKYNEATDKKGIEYEKYFSALMILKEEVEKLSKNIYKKAEDLTFI